MMFERWWMAGVSLRRSFEPLGFLSRSNLTTVKTKSSLSVSPWINSAPAPPTEPAAAAPRRATASDLGDRSLACCQLTLQSSVLRLRPQSFRLFSMIRFMTSSSSSSRSSSDVPPPPPPSGGRKGSSDLPLFMPFLGVASDLRMWW